jgi:phage repressor protein C with HTH and peptisase S24 domain
MSERNEWERDALVWLVGRRSEGRAHPGFDAWRASAAASAEREAAAARFAERVRSRVASAGRGVRLVDRLPEPVHPDPAVTPTAGLVAAPLVELGVAAGTGRELLEEPCEAWVALPPELPSGRYVALRVVGDSMTPLLHSGDVVLVDLDGTAAAGAVVVARHPEHGYVVKRVGRPRPGGLPLESLNPAYPGLVLSAGAGAVIGPVVLRWCGHGPAKPRLASAP